VLADRDRVSVAKVLSTPEDQSHGVLAGIDRLGVDPSQLRRFVHGTTVATNTVLERDGARTVLVTTAGFRDLLTIGRQARPRLYDLRVRRPEPLVPSGMVVEVTERIAADGSVVVRLEDTEVDRVVAAVGALDPAAVAVGLLFAFVAPDHERRLADALREHLAVPVTAASELLPVLREVERTSTAALNAYVAPRMDRYLTALTDRLRGAGLRVPVEVMRSGGGTFTARIAAREPVHTLLSGPAAGAWGAAALGRVAGVEDLIGFDVGGTSTDVTLVERGRPATIADGAIDGLPFAVTTTDIHTIGAGGGSLAWRDAGGALRVGPRSAGAVPGPAAYGRGGERPTVTDANLVLGRLDPDVRLGGAMPLHPDLAHAALTRLARELDLDPIACAAGIVRVTDAQMVKALRVVSVERGRDPRRFALVPFGGAGPLHQAALAAELGCPEVLVPPNPGVLSALGLLAAPVTVDRAWSQVGELAGWSDAALRGAFDELATRARAVLDEQDVEVARTVPTIDLRYRGQAFELEVAAPPDGTAEDLAARFHAAHRDRYGYDQPDQPIEVVTLRVRVEGATPDVPLPKLTGGGPTSAAVLAVHPVVDGGRTVEAKVLDRSRLGVGARIDGPAVVLGLDATVWVAPWQTGEIDDHGLLRLRERHRP
jgi:N-methylhydantoinase A